MQTGPSLESHSDDGPSAMTRPINPRDSAATSTQAASGNCADTDLGSVLDTIRKLVPGANQKTSKELTECLLGMCTPASTVVDLATNAPKTSQAAETAQEAIHRKYQFPTSEVLAIDPTLPAAKKFGHSKAALNTLQSLAKVQKFIRDKYNRLDDEDKKDMETALQSCEKSVHGIGATDNFFQLSENFGVLHNNHFAISEQYLEALNLGEGENGEGEKKEYQNLATVLNENVLDLSRQAISTLHPGKVIPGLFSKDKYASMYFWQGGQSLRSMSLALLLSCRDIVR